MLIQFLIIVGNLSSTLTALDVQSAITKSQQTPIFSYSRMVLLYVRIALTAAMFAASQFWTKLS
jgi:hypothetical protein